jgi:hypothetical protein
LRRAVIKVFRRRAEEGCTFEGLSISVAQPGRAVEAQSSHTQVHEVLSLVSLTPLKWSGESAHARQNRFSAGLLIYRDRRYLSIELERLFRWDRASEIYEEHQET